MKNGIKNILKAIVLISFAVFQFFGCKQIEDIKDSEKVAYITINNSLARSAMPELSIEKMTNFVLKGTFSGEEEQELGTWNDAESLKTAKIPIKPGLWDFKLTSQQGGVSFSATIEKKQIEVALNYLEFNLSVSTMDLQNGEGSISIDFKKILPYEKYAYSKYVCIYIYDLEGNKIKRLSTSKWISNIDDCCDVVSMGVENDVYYSYYKSVKSNIPAGTYFLNFTFYSEKSSVYYVAGEFRELVNITADCTSLLTVENLDLSNTYYIEYDLNGGSQSYTWSYYSPNTSKELPTSAKKTGYSFAGWYTDKDFSGEPVTEIPIGSTGNKKFYAKWKPATVKYKVEHYLQGISNSDKYFYLTYNDEWGKTEDYAAPVPREYSGFTAEVEQQQIAADGSTVVKIYYNRNDVTVTLKLNGGNINGRTEDFVISGKYLDTYRADDFYKDFGIKYDVPQKDGVYFESYNTDSDFLKKTSEFEFIFPASDTVCTAEYSLLDYRFKVFKEGKHVSVSSNSITFIYPFYIGETEVTCETWYKVQQWAINTYPEKYNSEKIKFNTIIEEPSTDSKDKPIVDISYFDAMLWCNAASEMVGLKPYYKIYGFNSDGEFKFENGAMCPSSDSGGYRLPTHDEWKYAAKGGEYLPSDYYGIYFYEKFNPSYFKYSFDSDKKYYYYKSYETRYKYYSWADTYAGTSDEDKLSEYAVLSGIESVKSKKPNSVGLYDMSGNANEYVFTQRIKSLVIMDDSVVLTTSECNEKQQNTGFRLARFVIE